MIKGLREPKSAILIDNLVSMETEREICHLKMKAVSRTNRRKVVFEKIENGGISFG